MTTGVIPAVTAEPKPRHSARSRGIHASLSNATPHHPGSPHANIDAAATHSMTTGVIPAVTAAPKLCHSSSNRRTQTSSFRAQSRNPCLAIQRHTPSPRQPPRQHRCCDYAEHDDRRHSSSNRQTQTSSFRAQSRNPCLAIQRHTPSPRQTPHANIDAAATRSMTTGVIPEVTAEPKPRHSAHSRGIHASRSNATPHHPGSLPHANIDAATTRSMTTGVIPEVTAEPKPRHSAHSRGIHASLSNSTPHHPGPPHANIDAAATHSMTTGVIPAVTAEPKPRHSAHSRGIHASPSNATPHHPGSPPRQHRCCDYAQHDDRRHSSSNRRTQTSSFRAQSRNPCLAIQRHTPSPRQPPRQHRCCSYAQHDDRRHSRSNRRTQTSSFRAQSRNPCIAIQRHTPSPRQPPTPT